MTETIERYKWVRPLTTRWMDNDLYGHVNNVTYYSYFDTVVNAFLIEVGHLDIHAGVVIGVVVESHCSYKKAIAYPEALRAGMRVDKLGNSSVTYGVGIFKAPSESDREADVAVAHGHFVHVFVDRTSRRPVAIPAELRAALASIQATG